MVLTPAGGLLEYPATGIIGDDPKAFQPTLYLYLPDFVLGPPTAATDKKHKFSVEGMRKAASGRSASKGFRKNKEVAWTFKARSHGELMSWWEKIDAIVKSSCASFSPSPLALFDEDEQLLQPSIRLNSAVQAMRQSPLLDTRAEAARSKPILTEIPKVSLPSEKRLDRTQIL